MWPMSLSPQSVSAAATPPRSTIRLLAALLFAAAALTVPAAGAQAAPRPSVQVGSLTLPPCQTSTLAWCLKTPLPFDHADPAAGTHGVYFEWYPATGGSAVGTVLTVQGGPGYGSTDYRDDYLKMLGPLTQTRNVLIVDLRGTGKSDPVTCAPVQGWKIADGNQAYIDAVGACGTQLNTTRRRADGSYVRGAELYTTANAARDVALLLDRLGTGKVDLYGDSYGTYFGQVFTARYAAKLRSVTLDAAYPVLGADSFYPDVIATARTAFDKVCARAAACAAAAPGSSWARITSMVNAVRAAPFTGVVKDVSGKNVTITIDVAAMVMLVQAAGWDNGVYRELDPAIRAYLDRGDRLPIQRLAARSLWYGDGGAVSEFSSGLYAANSCNDYPQAFSYSGTNAQRLAQYAAAVAALPSGMFAPFTVDEWVTSPAEEFDACLKWPAPVVDDAPITTGPPLAPATLPVLVLSGELDSLTSPAEGQRVAQQVGGSARWIQIGNMYHVSAMLDFVGCAEGLVRTFIGNPAGLMAMNASCAANMPEVHTPGAFPMALAQVTPAAAGAGNAAGADARRLAAVGASVVGDAIWNWWYVPLNKVSELRGGVVQFSGGPDVYTGNVNSVYWTTDVRVDGSLTWNRTTGHVSAALQVYGPGTLQATVNVSYDDYTPGGVATLTGSSGGANLVATVPIP